MSTGKSVRLFLAEGTPGGLLTAEIMNWTGHVIAAPRSDLAALLKRPEVGRTGIYILLGDDPDSLGGQLAYIGEGDDVGKRLYQHARAEEFNGKDFWDRAVVLTSKDTNLTKAHARYLESRLIQLAAAAKRVKLTNSTAPPPATLPEADVSDMEYFVDQAKIVLPVLGVNMLRTTEVQAAPQDEMAVGARAEQSPLFDLEGARYGVKATAQEIDGEFTVRAGSRARRTWVGAEGGYQQLRHKLEAEGALTPSDDDMTMVFGHDQVFASPSAAAAVVLGRSSNGRNEWKTAQSRMSYGDWQVASIEHVPGEGTT